MKILVCDAVSNQALEGLGQIKNAEVTVKTGLTPEELIKTIPEFHCAIVRSATKIRKNIIDAAKELKLVVRGGVGIDNIDHEYAQSKGIDVKNTPGASSVSVAELAIAHIFAVAKKIGFANNAIKAGKWVKKEAAGMEITGKTLGVLGFGRIGKETAKRASALGMNVLAYDPFIKTSTMEGVKLVDKDTLLTQADFFTLHMPFDPEQGAVIGGPEFSKMKKGVYIINCARGGVVDEKALVKAIKEGIVAGAGLDVFEQEPPVYKELIELDQVVCTPHVGAQTKEAQDKVGQEVVEVIAQWFAENPI
jgi:D-3-phosphoglycerate dehydrogenase